MEATNVKSFSSRITSRLSNRELRLINGSLSTNENAFDDQYLQLRLRPRFCLSYECTCYLKKLVGRSRRKCIESVVNSRAATKVSSRQTWEVSSGLHKHLLSKTSSTRGRPWLHHFTSESAHAHPRETFLPPTEDVLRGKHRQLSLDETTLRHRTVTSLSVQKTPMWTQCIRRRKTLQSSARISYTTSRSTSQRKMKPAMSPGHNKARPKSWTRD